MELTTTFDRGEIVYFKPDFRGLTPMRVSEIHITYQNDEKNVYYSLYNKQFDLYKQYVKEEQMFVSEAQAVAQYLRDN